jgi:hypothetical protein
LFSSEGKAPQNKVRFCGICISGSTFIYQHPFYGSTALQGESHLSIPFLGTAGLSPNFHIPVSVSDLNIPRISPHISLQQNWQTDPGNI